VLLERHALIVAEAVWDQGPGAAVHQPRGASPRVGFIARLSIGPRRSSALMWRPFWSFPNRTLARCG